LEASVDRCAVFVDAGYLFGAATNLLTGSHLRRTLRTDQAAMVDAIRRRAEIETGLPLLRIYWYDAARNRVPDSDQRALANLADIKLRLGNLRKREDGRYSQKGVDADLHADMTGMARNHGAADFILVSGDEDLLRAVDEAQSYGIRLHLWGVDGGGENNQSLELIGAADRRITLDETFLRQFFEVVPDAEEGRAGVEAVVAATLLNGDHADAGSEPTAVDHGPGNGSALLDGGESSEPEGQPVSVGDAGTEPEARPAIPTPAAVAAIAHRPESAAPHAATSSATAVVERDFLRLSDLTTREERYRDSEEDAAHQAATPFEVGRTYGARWRERATTLAVSAVAAQEPQIPRLIDAELLAYAERRGVNTWGPEEIKHAVRNGFWAALRH
jgi:uncharacterized LabA/DUF88 family protein